MDAKEKEIIDEILGAIATTNTSYLYNLVGMSPEENNEEKLCQALGKIIDSIEGGSDYLFETITSNKENNSDYFFLISYTSDFDKMQTLIENREEYWLSASMLKDMFVGLARSPKHRHIVEELIFDEKKIREYDLFNPYYMESIVCSLKDSVLVEKFLRETDFITRDDQEVGKLYFTPEETAEIIASTEDKKYIMRYATDSELMEEMRLDSKADAMAILAIASKDEMLMRTTAKKGALISKEKMLALILALEDVDTIKDAMKNPSFYGFSLQSLYELAFRTRLKREELEDVSIFSESEEGKMALAFITRDDSYISKSMKDVDVAIDLPEDMTIGIEIESIGFLGKIIQLRGRIDDWSAKADVSIKDPEGKEHGAEVVSPVLTGENQKTPQSIKKIAGMLENIGQHANSSCGGHVHIGANYLTSAQSFANLYELWANNEKILYAISNKEGEVPRNGIVTYAGPISKDLEDSISKKESPDTVQIDTPEDLENFKKKIADQQKGRYKGINFKNLGEDGKGTIEFRPSNGTVDAKTWIENINLYGGLIRAAEEISLIQAKSLEERTEEEKEKLALFDSLGTDESLKDEERLEVFLKLTIRDPKKREVYRRRFITNSKLIEDDEVLRDSLRASISNKLIRYSDMKAIGKAVFTGKEPVDGEMMRDIDEWINEDTREAQEIKGNYGQNRNDNY